MGGIKTAGDLVARMQLNKMRLTEAKEYVAGKLGVSVFDLSDSTTMRTGARGARHRRRDRRPRPGQGPGGQGAHRRPARHPHQLGRAAEGQDGARHGGRLTTLTRLYRTLRPADASSSPAGTRPTTRRLWLPPACRREAARSPAPGWPRRRPLDSHRRRLKETADEGTSSSKPSSTATTTRRTALTQALLATGASRPRDPRRGPAPRHGGGRRAHARGRLLHPRGAALRPRHAGLPRPAAPAHGRRRRGRHAAPSSSAPSRATCTTSARTSSACSSPAPASRSSTSAPASRRADFVAAVKEHAADRRHERPAHHHPAAHERDHRRCSRTRACGTRSR